MRNNQASRTAQVIARGLLLLARDRSAMSQVPVQALDFLRAFLRSSGVDIARYERLCSSRAFRHLVIALSDWLIPGLLMHYALRKRFIEEEVRRQVVAGATQVVVLGGGFDTLALRLCREFQRCNFIEVDHPATQAVKRKALQSMDWSVENLTFVTADFTKSFEDAILQNPNYNSAAVTVFVAEGLLMYLPEAQVEKLLDFVRIRSGAESTFAFTFLETQPNGQVFFWHKSALVVAWLRTHGEPFRWGIKRDDLSSLLAAHGFAPDPVVRTAQDLQMLYVPANLQYLHSEGDMICVAIKAPEQ